MTVNCVNYPLSEFTWKLFLNRKTSSWRAISISITSNYDKMSKSETQKFFFDEITKVL